MAKIPFGKLNLVKNTETTSFSWGENIIEVKKYLPMEEKLQLITRVLQQSIDENNFYNPCRIDLYRTIEIVLTYANISITDKQKEDLFKLYDLFIGSGFASQVMNHIEPTELDYIFTSIDKSVKSVYDYTNSVMGILDRVKTDYSNLNLDAEEIKKQLTDPEAVGLLKDILDKLG